MLTLYYCLESYFVLEILSGACKLLSCLEEGHQESISEFNAAFHVGIIFRT